MIKTQDIYDSLYLDKEKFIILVTGGRGSGKSFNVAAFIESLSFEPNHKILYSRYTLNSAKDTIIPEFQEKIEFDGVGNHFHVTNSDVINETTGSEIMFRGIKTSSGNQTAKLKSIHGLTTFVCDEAEEWVSEKDFDTLRLSIRQKGIQNRVIIIMNPTDKHHFVYKKYIETTHKLVEYDGVEVQISTHPDVLHIHTTFLDNIEHLSDEFIKEAEQTKKENPDKYAKIYMGQWADRKEGVIFKYETVDEIPHWLKKRWLGLDFGFSSDPSALVEVAIDGNDLYLDEKLYRTEMLTSEIIRELKKYPYYKIISESADPRMVQEISNAGINIHPVVKYAGSIEAGINKMLEFNIKITKKSKNLKYEYSNLIWAKTKDGERLNIPEPGDDHLIDATRYVILSEVLGRRPSRTNLLTNLH